MMRVLILSLVASGLFLTAQSQGFEGRDEFFCFREPEATSLPRLSLPDVFRPRQQEASSNGASTPVIRGQSPSTFETPPIMTPSTEGGVPFGIQGAQDPFIYAPDPVLGNPGGTTLSGVNGPQPYRLGFTPRFDYVYMAPANTSVPGGGDFQSQYFNFEVSHTSPIGPGWALTNTPQFGIGLWDGPVGVDMPGSVFRFGWDFNLATPLQGPWSMQVGFNPSINSDLKESLGSEAFNFDVNAMLFYRASPQWMWVLGAGFWDRVDQIVLPYAGVVWNPNDLWELRLLFPKARISYFLGNFGSASHWLYVSGEYHVESYQIDQVGLPTRQQVQLADYRVGLGLRSDHGWYDKSLEVGYLFGRNVDFKHTTPGFDISDTFMARFAIRF